jgi:sulfate transport system ATP-binding protein
MSIEIRGLSRRYGATAALDGIDLAVGRGEFVALLGPSGSGKTTLLRIIAGLDDADAGELLIDGRDARRLTPRERRIGLVFQHYALFRHMTVAKNVAFGLEVLPSGERPSRAAIDARVGELLALMQLDGLGRRFPGQLSGGQRQRVALARALAAGPAVLLLDEPFGALDAKVRDELRTWLRELQQRLAITTLFVTHDQDEALLLADRVAIMNQGRIEQVGAPAEIYDRPATPFATEFLGAANRFEGGIRDEIFWGEGGALPIPRAVLRGCPEGPAVAFVRPHHVRLRPAGIGPRAVVRAVGVAGPRLAVELAAPEGPLRAEIERAAATLLKLRPGVALAFDFLDATVFPAGSADVLPLRRAAC